MHNYKSKSTTIAGLVIMSTFVISCTKEVPYKSVYKGDGTEKVQEKKVIDTNAEYLYVVSSDLANQDSSGASEAMPYWQGEEKIVKFQFTKDALQVLQVNEEQRLKDNKTNDKILLEIPVTHVDYQCATDRYDKCTNQEVENREIDWSKKKKFLPSFDNMKSVGFNLFPVEMDKVFGYSCFTETGSQFLNYELTDTSLNIQVRKTFKGNPSCLAEKNIRIKSLDDLHTEIIYHYSFAKLNSMESRDYKPLLFPNDDESTFGFFTTQNKKYDVDYTHTAALETQFMNRWNPERTEIVYYLTDNFNKPEFKSIKEATYKAFNHVNNGLAAAGLSNRLVLKEPDHKVPGDLRNSMIVLVEDPIASAGVGYGPTVANPRTGEIMSGRVVVYHGNFLQAISYSYDEVVRELRREKAKGTSKVEETKPSTSAADSSAEIKVSQEIMYKNQLTNSLRSIVGQKISKSINSLYSRQKIQTNTNDFIRNSAIENSIRMGRNKYEYLVSDKKNTARDVLSAMSKYCNYPMELFPFNDIVKNAIKSKLNSNPKFWHELSAEDKKVVISVILPKMWVHTLVHELGHNLGLRHNFGASEDKQNFYNKEELFKMGIQFEIPYSSVMDYGYSGLNQLTSLGKYDIAALRFGYKREIEAADGKILKVQSTLQDLKKQLEQSNSKTEIKEYKYCSDEHVDVNPNCQRFDAGTTYPEIVDKLIQAYEKDYSRRNFRNGRDSFSKANDGGYYLGTWSRFMQIRAFMERYESVKAKFHIADNDSQWNTDSFLKDLKTAAIKSGQFFLKVLKTPDVICAIAKSDNPQKIIEFDALDLFGGNVLSCFDLQLKDDFIVVGQAGKMFNDRKDPDSDNNYADQIDVRGIWPDKLAAIRALLYRTIGNNSFDHYEDNYTDIPELQEVIGKTLAAMMFNQIVTPVTFVDREGYPVTTLNVGVRTFDSPSAFKTGIPSHWIETVYNENVAKTVGLPLQQVSLQQMIFQTIADSSKGSQSHRSESQNFLNNFAVTKVLASANVPYREDVSVKDIGDSRFIAFPENTMANNLIILGNTSATISKLTDAELDQLIQEKTAQQQAAPGQAAAQPAPQTAAAAPVPQSKFGPEFKKISLTFLLGYKSGNLAPEETYNYLLSLLPVANQK